MKCALNEEAVIVEVGSLPNVGQRPEFSAPSSLVLVGLLRLPEYQRFPIKDKTILSVVNETLLGFLHTGRMKICKCLITAGNNVFGNIIHQFLQSIQLTSRLCSCNNYNHNDIALV